MIEQDITAIDSLIIHDTQANIDYLRQVAIHLTERQETPLYQKILLLSLKMIDYQGQEHILSGVILEYIFAATKLHDDTMAQRISCKDEVLSQGVKSTDSRILIGDFFYSRAFSLMATMGKMKVVFHLSNAINQYTEGQSRQLLQAVDMTTTEEMYFERLQQKSSLYFTSVAQVVAELGDCTEEQAQRLCDFSLHLGMAEQVIEETLCCIRGNQADQHKQPSLPFLVIRGLDQASPVLRQLIQSDIAQSSVTTDMIAQICVQTDALMYIHRYVEGEIKLAIESVVIFPESNYRQALQVLATDLLARFDQELAGLGFS